MARGFLVLAAVSGFVAVALGAFGAHGLRGMLSADLLAVYQTGVQYQMFHTLALLAVGLMALRYPRAAVLKWAGYLFVAGIVIFSGSLYVLALSGERWLGAVTPFGGVAFLFGWFCLAVAAWRLSGVGSDE